MPNKKGKLPSKIKKPLTDIGFTNGGLSFVSNFFINLNSRIPIQR